MNYPSRHIEATVNELKKLPGVGEKTALRFVLHLLSKEDKQSLALSNALEHLANDIKRCTSCCNYADSDLCTICSNPSRDKQLICVVETVRDFLAIESTGMFRGRYHILGGVISPMDGIGPEQLHISQLVKRIEEDEVTELIMALNPTMEGDTTAFYISKQVADKEVTISTIARGVSFGGELEYTDELTLARSIATRQPYDHYMVNR